MAKEIKISYDGIDYTLTYTRRTASIMEQNGFRIGEVLNQPMTMLPQLFAGAFLANHRRIKQDTIDAIFARISNKNELIGKLTEMYSDTLDTLMDEPDETDMGKVEWAADW